MNNVILVGRLTRDPEVRYTQSQMAVARFNVAVNRPKDKNGEQTADFIETIAFGKTAELIEKYFSKGSQIGIQGKIQNNNYTNKDGVKVYSYQVVVDRIEFIGNKDNTASNSNAEVSDPLDGFTELNDDDSPF